MTNQVSEALKRVKPSATMAMSAKARALKAAGRDCIALSQGEPDFDTPENIKEAAIRAMREGKTKYTDVDGIPELKDAIVAKFKRENGLEYTRAQINVSPGGKPVIFNAWMATINPGDEVIIPAPYWVSYPDMAIMCGGTPVFIDTSIESGFKIQPEALAKAITPHTKWLLLNSPSNPSGAAYTRAELKALAAVLIDYPHVLVITDDMYEHLTYGDFEFTTIAQVEPRLYERTLTMNGVSKAYSMTGWRIGYAGRSAMADQSDGQRDGADDVEPMLDLAMGGRRSAERHAGFHSEEQEAFRRTPRPRCVDAEPSAGPEVSDAGRRVLRLSVLRGTDRQENAERQSHRKRRSVRNRAAWKPKAVALVHGGAFGLSPNFRISYATSNQCLEEACARIQRFCASLS